MIDLQHILQGVNGVGKSTTLAKLARLIRQVRMYASSCDPRTQTTNSRVMVAACDTFRSGAVEQLRKHCNALDLKLFDRGYGTDPAVVAKAAVRSAMTEGFDVVLIDTAGRMQVRAPFSMCRSKFPPSHFMTLRDWVLPRGLKGLLRRKHCEYIPDDLSL